jgi:outer membrane protein
LKRILLILAALLTVAAAMPALAQQQGKIGFVDPERIFRESVQGKKARARMDAEGKKREAELTDMASKLQAAAQKLEKDGPVLSDSQKRERQSQLQDMDRQLQSKQRDYRDEMGQKDQAERIEIIQSAGRAMKAIADREGYDVILQEAAYYNPKVDITDKVIKAMGDAAK